MKYSLRSLMVVAALVWVALGIAIANLQWVPEYEPLFLDTNGEAIEDGRLSNEPNGDLLPLTIERDPQWSTDETSRWFEQFQRETMPLPNSSPSTPNPPMP